MSGRRTAGGTAARVTASGNAELSAVMDAAGALLHAANGTNVDYYQVDPSTGALNFIGPSGTGG